jgi:hypothetical protein
VKEQRGSDVIKRKITLDEMKMGMLNSNLALSIQRMLKVGKPNRQKFYKVKSGDESFFDALVIVDNTEGSSETYLIDPEVVSEVVDEAIHVVFHLTISKAGDLLLWQSRLPDESGKLDDWNRSALRIKEIAQKNWVRVLSNRSHGCYEPIVAKEFDDEPVWPEESLEELVNEAFKDHYIDSLDHPVLKKLRGEH